MLLAALEARLAAVGSRALVAQPREGALPLFTSGKALGGGWQLVHPADAVRLHRTLPVAFYDAAIVEKELSCQGGPP
jgi:hypothetical protein